MKRIIKLFSIVIIAAIVLVSFTTCEGENGNSINGSDGNNTSNGGSNPQDNETAVTFSGITANGSGTQTTTMLTLTFSQAIAELNANDISLSGVSGVTKGTFNASGANYTIGISGFTAGGSLTVTVTKSGYKISNSSRTVTIYHYNGGSNPQDNGTAAENKKRLMNYLSDQYGVKIISGQMDASWTTNATIDMIKRVFTDTGKYPALKGFDFIDLPNSWGGYGKNQIDEAIEWWDGKNNGVKLLPSKPDTHGIVTFCWHWRAGSAMDFYSDNTNFRIPWTGSQTSGTLNTSHSDFATIKTDLDKVAALLQQLKDKGIPVLWRPLHEAVGNWTPGNPNGAWFWWGASGPAPYIALWEYMYDYFTNTKGLDNLIWVWNGQHEAWVPDPSTIDIIGYDYYPWPRDTTATAQNYNSQIEVFNRAKAMVGDGKTRIVALAENGAIPDPAKCKQDGAMWSWFMTWNDSDNSDYPYDNFWNGGLVNTTAHKNHVYTHDLVITLDKLPDLTEYRLEGDIVTPPANTVITLTQNGDYGWQYLLRSDTLFNAPITQGEEYTFTYSFTSNVNMDKFSVFFADNVGGWRRISNYVDVKTNITAGAVISGTATITADGTATNATSEANIMGFDAGTGTASSPTLTFTTFSLQKNN